jgi:hypothetical protein
MVGTDRVKSSVRDLAARDIKTTNYYAVVIGGRPAFSLKIESEGGEASIVAVEEAIEFLSLIKKAMEDTAPPNPDKKRRGRPPKEKE